MGEQANRKRPTYSDEFKRDAVRLVVEQRYSFIAACQAVGACDATLRAWHANFAPAPEPCGDDATLEELRAELIRARKQLKRAELEREINKNATALCLLAVNSCITATAGVSTPATTIKEPSGRSVFSVR